MNTKKKLKTTLLAIELTLISLVIIALLAFAITSITIMFINPEAEYSEWFGETFFGVEFEKSLKLKKKQKA